MAATAPPAARMSARVTAWSGTRTAMVSSGDRLAGNSGRRGTMSVSGPGQKWAISAAAAGGMMPATWATSATSPNKMGIPFSAGRPLTA